MLKNRQVKVSMLLPRLANYVSRLTSTLASPSVDSPMMKNRQVKKAEKKYVEKKAMVASIEQETHELCARAQLKAIFYPKFENEKSDQEVRTKMIQTVSDGNGVLEVTLKHSGSLFLFSGDNGGAFAKNSYGNLYTAVGVFVLGRTLQAAWGEQGPQKQQELNKVLKESRLCIAMELVTAVLGDHGQRPLQDYVVVTAVSSLEGRPHFYSTPDVIAFCHKWRLPTNHVWLYSTRQSASSFFSAFDALCEEGTASIVAATLTETADMSVPATKSHEEVQGEILEGLVARVVDADSIIRMKSILHLHPAPGKHNGGNVGPDLRAICAANRESEAKQVKALLERVGLSMCSDVSDWFDENPDKLSKSQESDLIGNFLKAKPMDYATRKLQELCNVMRERKLPVRFKCRLSSREANGVPQDSSTKSFKMTIHVYSDDAFRRYQKEMRKQPSLWPLFRGFFVNIDLDHSSSSSASPAIGDVVQRFNDTLKLSEEMDSDQLGVVEETENLMLKLKFLPYKLRTFLIRNGLATLLEKGIPEYRIYYMRQLKNWGVSPGKQKELVALLNEWAPYAKKHAQKKITNTYLTLAEPFLEKYAKKSVKNLQLIGAAGNAVHVEQYLAEGAGYGSDAEDESAHDIIVETAEMTGSSLSDTKVKAAGIIVFFPGIPGCAKSALCAEILKIHDLGRLNHLMGDLTKGKYWPKLEETRKKQPKTITLADKNAPNDEVWQQIEQICETTQAIGIPVIVDSEGTTSNPYSVEALVVFIFRVLQRANHPGKLDKASQNPGAVLLIFYNLYEGKDRREFVNELRDRFGYLVEMPFLKPNRPPTPEPILDVIQQGLRLYKRHTAKHGRLESLKGTFKDEWAKWELKLRETLFAHSGYLNSIQIPFQDSAASVIQQLQAISKGDNFLHSKKAETSFHAFTFAAVVLPPSLVLTAVNEIAKRNSVAKLFLAEKNLEESLTRAHVTLAHKNSHGVAAVARYAEMCHTPAPVNITAILFSDTMCALEATLNSAGPHELTSKNSWPHVTVWTGSGIKPKMANTLPNLVAEGKATRVNITPPITLVGTVNFL